MNVPSEYKDCPDEPGLWERHIKWSNGTSVSQFNIIDKGDGKLKWWKFKEQAWFYVEWFDEIPQITWRKIK